MSEVSLHTHACVVPQEKRSSYAPKEDEAPVRYDGIYRIRSCWRSKGAQGYLVCRYLFIRCDNAPAPWSSEGQRSAHTLIHRHSHFALLQHHEAWLNIPHLAGGMSDAEGEITASEDIGIQGGQNCS